MLANEARVFYPMPHDKTINDELGSILSRMSGGTFESELAAENIDDATKVRCPTCGKFMMGRPMMEPPEIAVVAIPQRPPFHAIGRQRRKAARLAKAKAQL